MGLERYAHIHPNSVEQQLWQGVRAHLKTLEKLQALSSDDTSLLETKRTRYVENGLPESERDDLESAYKQVDVRFNEEAQYVVMSGDRSTSYLVSIQRGGPSYGEVGVASGSQG